MILKNALRIGGEDQVAIVGAGGKTSAMLHIAREMNSRVIVSTSTHLGVDQANLADWAYIVRNTQETKEVLKKLSKQTGVIMITGSSNEHDRYESPSPASLRVISRYCRDAKIPFLIEADGSKFRPLKAPGEHEPPIPAWVNMVVVVVGLSGIGGRANATFVHRPEIFCQLAGIKQSAKVTTDVVANILVHVSGGLKNIPEKALKCALLNQVDDPDRLVSAEMISRRILGIYDIVVASRLLDDQMRPILSPVVFRDEPIAGIILAAGGSSRYGSQKMILDWFGKPLIQHVVDIVVASGLRKIVVVTGENSESIERILAGYPVNIVHNPSWRKGQSTSLKAGLRALNEFSGGSIFFLGDQPGISVELVHALLSVHRKTDEKILAPSIKGKRTTPTLFDRSLYDRLMQVSGDEGGRQLFTDNLPHLISWKDSRLALDIDTPEEYHNVRERFG